MLESKIVEIAKVCHQADKGICESWGDFSQKDWDDLPKEHQECTVAYVEYLLLNSDVTPIEQHDAWVQSKLAIGWVRWNPDCIVPNTHPCMVEYEELGHQRHVRDTVFAAIVRRMAANFAENKEPYFNVVKVRGLALKQTKRYS